ncbi:MAG: methylated-DNA--[protein]-cysteine S-methyltransferase [Hyphomonas sp.]
MRPASYHLFETEAGTCGLGWNAAGLTQVQLPEETPAATETRLARRSGGSRTDDLPAPVADCAARMRAYFEGAETSFADVALDLSGVSAFNAKIYAALRGVGWGEATSYGAFAAAIGEPGAARAIGAAMGANPWPLIVPCHRVLAANGKIGGFSAHGGRATKRHMLQLERIDADGAAPMLPGFSD